MKKKILALLMSICMILTIMPVGLIASATDSGSSIDVQNNTDSGSESNTNDVGADTPEPEREADLTISTADELMAFAAAVTAGDNFKDKIVRLGADIDLSGKEWAPIGGDSVYFRGEFDGNGKTISNLTQTKGARVGLFGLVEYSYIHDLTLKDVSFTVGENSSRVGAIAGNLQYWNVLEDVTIDGIKVTVNGNDGLIGSVAGYVWKSQLGNVDVKNAEFIVNGTGNVIGGNTGYGRAHIWDTGVTDYNANWLEGTVQTINGTEYVLQNYYTQCYVDEIKIVLNGTGNEAGGFFGSDTYNSHSNYFVDCHVKGLDVECAEGTSQLVGGFIAWNNGTTTAGTVNGFEGCTVEGTIDGADGTYGGFAGSVGGRACTYSKASADVDITCTGTAGGFVGVTQAYSTHAYSFSGCEATGDVTAAVAGGFAGKNGLSGDGKSVYVTYTDCAAAGAVVGTEIAGGLVGEVNTELPATNWNVVDSTGYLTLVGNTASTSVTGPEGKTAALVGYMDGVANSDAVEGNKVILQLADNEPVDGVNISDDTSSEDVKPLENAVAKVGFILYETLADAVNAAKDGATVTLIKNAEGAGIKFENENIKNITIDFGGYTYALTEGVGSANTPTNGMQILSGNTVTLKNGTLKVAEGSESKFYILIQNYADLTITDMTLDGTGLDRWALTDGDSYVLSNNSGNVVIDGKTNITANNDGDLAVAFDVYDDSSYESPVVTVNTTGLINGNIEVSSTINDNLVIKNGTFTMDVSEWAFGAKKTTAEGKYVIATEANVYYIYDANDLVKFAASVTAENTYADKKVVLMDDIDLAGVKWTPVGGWDGSVLFAGEFDGNEKTISNLTIDTTNVTASKYRGGLFANLDAGSSVHDLTIKTVKVTAANGGQYGAVAGRTGANLENIYVEGFELTASVDSVYAGAVAGITNYYESGEYGFSWKNVDAKDITINLNGTGTSYGGGLLGGMNLNGARLNTYEGCDVTNVTINSEGNGWHGGMWGWHGRSGAFNYVKNCSVTNVNITAEKADDNRLGGICGFVGVSGGLFENVSVNGGNLKANVGYAGGFAPWSYAWGQDTYKNCTVTNVNVTCTNGVASGFVAASGAGNQTTKCVDCSVVGGTVTGKQASGFAGIDHVGNAGGAFILEGCTSSATVVGTEYAAGLIANARSSYQTVVTDSSFEGAVSGEKYVCEGIITKHTDESLVVANGVPVLYTEIIGEDGNPVEETNYYAAIINSKGYATLAEAVEAANANVDADGNPVATTIVLLSNITLGEKLTISGNVTISGEFTITRDDAYAGTLFAVSAGATLTLDGGLVIDGANEYTFNKELYDADLANWETAVPAADSAKWFTPEAGAPVATAYMITTSGTVNLNKVTIKNHYSTNGSGIVSASKGAIVTLDGAQITHNASTNGSGLVVNASGSVYSREEALITVTMNEGTVIDGNHVGGNHGIFKIYMGTYFTMNGGEIKNTTGWNSNGTVVGIYHGVFTMNGGTICSNSSVYGPNNGRNAAIYGHSNHLFIMNDGTICHNTGRSKGGVDSPYSETGYSGSTVINGGTVADNSVTGTWTEPDVAGGATLTINGGTFGSDVTKYLAPGIGMEKNADGTYGITEELYEYNGVAYKTLQDVINAIAATPATLDDETTVPTVKVLASHKIDDVVNVTANMILDLNGKTITFTSAAKHGFYIFADVTVKNGSVITEGSTSYCFIVGKRDTYAGNLTIESGSYKSGDCTVVSVTQGTLTINDGTFEAAPYNDAYDFTLNCVDDLYKAGEAKIFVKGGSFKGFNPADNAAESGGHTNFCAEGYTATQLEDGIYGVTKVVATIDDAEYATLADAIAAANDGDTIKLLVDVAVADSVVINKNITLDLGGNTLSAASTLSNKPVIRVLAKVTVENGTVDGTTGINSYAIIVGNSDTAGELTIADGTYKGITSAISITKGVANISGGEFMTAHDGEGVDYGSDFVLNCIDSAYKAGSAVYNITGGKFYGFNPENNVSEAAETNYLTDEYTGVAVDEYYKVVTYVEWVKEQLLAGNNVVLDRDIVLNDYSFVESIPALSNGNGKYGVAYGNGAIFNVVEKDATLDLNGHSITLDAHDEDYCGKRVVSLFYVTDGATLTIKDSVGTAKVDIYGMATAVYSVAVDSKAVLEGGTWNGYACKTCGWYNSFLYASHGGQIEITGGSYSQVKNDTYGDCLIVVHGASKEGITSANGVNYSLTSIEISGGTFSSDPSKALYIDNSNNNAADYTANACEEGFGVIANSDGTYGVKPVITVTFDDFEIVNGNELPEFKWTSDFDTVVKIDGVELTVETPSVTIDGAGEYEIKATAKVNSTEYVVEVVPGKLTVVEAVAEVNGIAYATLQDAIDAAGEGDTVKLLADITIKESIKIAADDKITLDLNGHTLQTDATVNDTTSVHVIENLGDLTIIDSVGDGAIISNDCNTAENGAKTKNGFAVSSTGNSKLTIDGAKIVGTNWGYALYVVDNATLVVEKGTVIEGRGAIYVDGSANATINGGEFAITVTTTNNQDNVMYVGGNAEVVVNGGDFDATQVEVSQRIAIAALGSSKLTINDGTFKGLTGDVQAKKSSSVSIIGGTFNGIKMDERVTDAIAISGGTYAYDPTEWCAEGWAAEKGADGTYSIVVAQATIGSVGYATLEDALAAAQAGDTVKLLADTELKMVTVTEGITLDLNGYTLTASYLVAFTSSNVVDNSEGKTGFVKIPEKHVLLCEGNAQMPLYTGEGYVFATMKMQQMINADEVTSTGYTVKIRPSFGTVFNEKYLATRGAAGCHVSIYAKMTWSYEDESGNVQIKTQNIEFTEEMIKDIYSDGLALAIVFSDLSEYKDFSVTAVVESDYGVIIEGSEPLVFTPAAE